MRCKPVSCCTTGISSGPLISCTSGIPSSVAIFGHMNTEMNYNSRARKVIVSYHFAVFPPSSRHYCYRTFEYNALMNCTLEFNFFCWNCRQLFDCRILIQVCAHTPTVTYTQLHTRCNQSYTEPTLAAQFTAVFHTDIDTLLCNIPTS